MPYSACHRALYTVDILEAVLAEDIVTQATCKHVALTCQLFSQVALPFVWNDLGSLLPLWGVLLPDGLPPSIDLYTAPEEWEGLVEEILQQKLYEDPVRWERFLSYASFVREIFHCGANPCGLDGNLIYTLILRNGGFTFLPRLQYLCWRHFNHARDLLPMICGPALKHLHIIIRGSTSRPRRSPLLETATPPEALLPSAAPSLESLELDSSPQPPEEVTTALINAVPRFPRLYSFTITPCDIGPPVQVQPRDLPRLLSAPALEILNCIVGSCEDQPEIPPTFHAPGLRRLWLAGSFEELSPVISRPWHSPRLEGLSISGERFFNYEPTDVRDILAAVSSSSISQTLRSLSVDGEDWLGHIPYEVDLVHDIMRPCFSLTALQSLNIAYDVNESIKILCSDESMLTLARALANLRRLSMTVGTHGERLTPTTLLHLAKHCPHLVALHLEIPFEVVGAKLSSPRAPRPDHPLCDLVLVQGASLAFGDHHAEFARFLDCVFPNLDVRLSRQMAGLRHMPGDESSDSFLDQMWNQVKVLQQHRSPLA